MAQAARGGDLPPFVQLPDALKRVIASQFLGPEEIGKLELVSTVFKQALQHDQTWFMVAQNLMLAVPQGMTAKAVVYGEYEKRVSEYIDFANTQSILTNDESQQLQNIPNVFQRYTALKKVLSERMNRDEYRLLLRTCVVGCSLDFLRFLKEAGANFQPDHLSFLSQSRSNTWLEKMSYITSQGIEPNDDLFDLAFTRFGQQGDLTVWNWLIRNYPARARVLIERERDAPFSLTPEQRTVLLNLLP